MDDYADIYPAWMALINWDDVADVARDRGANHGCPWAQQDSNTPADEVSTGFLSNHTEQYLAPDNVFSAMGTPASFGKHAAVPGPQRSATTEPESSVQNTGNPGGLLTALKRRRNRQGGKELRCEWANCTFDGTFPRQYELDRHHVAKHKGQKPFWCPVLGCVARDGPPKFSRSDKLTAHIRMVHHNDSMIVCVHGSCATDPLPRDLMGIHVCSHVGAEGASNAHIKAVANSASASHVTCPLWRCGRHVLMEALPGHMMEHDSEELLAEADAIHRRGYLLLLAQSPPCSEKRVTGAVRLANRPIVAIQVLCPVCSEAFQDHQQLKKHLVLLHMVKDVQHYSEWAEYLRNLVTEKGARVFDIAAILAPWAPLRKRANIMASVTLYCPACSHAEVLDYGSGGARETKHHTSMLNKPDNLYRVRREILMLCPDFASHPVFDDLRQPSDQLSTESGGDFSD